MIKRAQNRIAESRATLPWTAVICLLIWLVGGVITRGWWLQMGVASLAMLMMALLNNVNALIRIYSRMISCSFIVLMTMTAYLWPQLSAGMAALAVTTFYLLLFQTYQDKRAMGMIFYAYAMLGIGSIFWVQLLWLVPVFWILMATNILAFSGRTFFASILGLVLPYWFLGGYYFLTGQPTSSMSGPSSPSGSSISIILSPSASCSCSASWAWSISCATAIRTRSASVCTTRLSSSLSWC